MAHIRFNRLAVALHIATLVQAALALVKAKAMSFAQSSFIIQLSVAAAN